MHIIPPERIQTQPFGEPPSHEERSYYVSDYTYIVVTRIHPGREQQWHWHDHHGDSTIVIQGEIEVSELKPGQKPADAVWETVKTWGFVNFPPGPKHNVRNRSTELAVMVTTKPRWWPDGLTSEQALAECRDDRMLLNDESERAL